MSIRFFRFGAQLSHGTVVLTITGAKDEGAQNSLLEWKIRYVWMAFIFLRLYSSCRNERELLKITDSSNFFLLSVRRQSAEALGAKNAFSSFSTRVVFQLNIGSPVWSDNNSGVKKNEERGKKWTKKRGNESPHRDRYPPESIKSPVLFESFSSSSDLSADYNGHLFHHKLLFFWSFIV